MVFDIQTEYRPTLKQAVTTERLLQKQQAKRNLNSWQQFFKEIQKEVEQ